MLVVVALAALVAIGLFLMRKGTQKAKSTKEVDSSPSEGKRDTKPHQGARSAPQFISNDTDAFIAMYKKCGLVRVPGSKTLWHVEQTPPAVRTASASDDFIAMFKKCGFVRVPGSQVEWQTESKLPAAKAAPAPLAVKTSALLPSGSMPSPTSATDALAYSPKDCVEHPEVGEWGRYVVNAKPDASTAQSKALALDWYTNPNVLARGQPSPAAKPKSLKSPGPLGKAAKTLSNMRRSMSRESVTKT